MNTCSMNRAHGLGIRYLVQLYIVQVLQLYMCMTYMYNVLSAVRHPSRQYKYSTVVVLQYDCTSSIGVSRIVLLVHYEVVR
jgi:hypothetical protein